MMMVPTVSGIVWSTRFLRAVCILDSGIPHSSCLSFSGYHSRIFFPSLNRRFSDSAPVGCSTPVNGEVGAEGALRRSGLMVVINVVVFQYSCTVVGLCSSIYRVVCQIHRPKDASASRTSPMNLGSMESSTEYCTV
jgi:hypothetical protein